MAIESVTPVRLRALYQSNKRPPSRDLVSGANLKVTCIAYIFCPPEYGGDFLRRTMDDFIKINPNWYRRKDGMVSVRRVIIFDEFDEWEIFNTHTGKIYKTYSQRHPTSQNRLEYILWRAACNVIKVAA